MPDPINYSGMSGLPGMPQDPEPPQQSPLVKILIFILVGFAVVAGIVIAKRFL